MVVPLGIEGSSLPPVDRRRLDTTVPRGSATDCLTCRVPSWLSNPRPRFSRLSKSILECSQGAQGASERPPRTTAYAIVRPFCMAGCRCRAAWLPEYRALDHMVCTKFRELLPIIAMGLPPTQNCWAPQRRRWPPQTKRPTSCRDWKRRHALASHQSTSRFTGKASSVHLEPTSMQPHSDSVATLERVTPR